MLSNADEDGSGTVSVNDTLTYQFVATNTGNVTLTGVTIVDPLPGLSALVCTPTQPATLAPAASMTCTATYVVTQADVDAGVINNTATGDSNETPPVDDPATVPVPQNPALGLDKTLLSNADEDGSGTVSLGDTLTYQFVATNTGNVTLTGMTIVDPLPGLSALVCTPTQPATLAPAASMTCTATYVVTQADVDAGVINNTATGDSNETPPVDDPATVPVPQNPAVEVDKTADITTDVAPTGLSVGDEVTYTYAVENTGNVTLFNVTVTDPHTGLSTITCTPPQGSTLAPGDTMTCTATYVVTQADVDAGEIVNLGTVTGTDANDDPVTDDDPLQLPIEPNPAIQIVKLPNYQAVQVGDTVTFTIEVTNVGNVTLSNVTVTDPVAPDCDALWARLLREHRSRIRAR